MLTYGHITQFQLSGFDTYVDVSHVLSADSFQFTLIHKGRIEKQVTIPISSVFTVFEQIEKTLGLVARSFAEKCDHDWKPVYRYDVETGLEIDIIGALCTKCGLISK